MTMNQEMTGFLGRAIKDGDAVYRQSEPGKTMFVLQKGQIELRRREGDKEFCLATLEDGDFFGTSALFGEPERFESAVAVGDAWVLSLQKEALLRRINEDASLALRMMESMSSRIRELERALVALGSRQPDVGVLAQAASARGAKTRSGEVGSQPGAVS